MSTLRRAAWGIISTCIIGEISDRVTPGSPDTGFANEETWYVPPGSAAMFELPPDLPGDYSLVDHALYRVLKGAAGMLHVTGRWDTGLYAPEASEASCVTLSSDLSSSPN